MESDSVSKETVSQKKAVQRESVPTADSEDEARTETDTSQGEEEPKDTEDTPTDSAAEEAGDSGATTEPHAKEATGVKPEAAAQPDSGECTSADASEAVNIPTANNASAADTNVTTAKPAQIMDAPVDSTDSVPAEATILQAHGIERETAAEPATTDQVSETEPAVEHIEKAPNQDTPQAATEELEPAPNRTTQHEVVPCGAVEGVPAPADDDADPSLTETHVEEKAFDFPTAE